MMGRTQERRRDPMVPRRGLTGPVRIGWTMALFLALQTFLEYVIALTVDKNFPIMVIINLTEAALIMVYFMHITRLWREERE